MTGLTTDAVVDGMTHRFSAVSPSPCNGSCLPDLPSKTQSWDGWNCSVHLWSHPPHVPSCDFQGLAVHAHTAWLLAALLYPRGLVCTEWTLLIACSDPRTHHSFSLPRGNIRNIFNTASSSNHLHYQHLVQPSLFLPVWRHHWPLCCHHGSFRVCFSHGSQRKAKHQSSNTQQLLIKPQQFPPPSKQTQRIFSGHYGSVW